MKQVEILICTIGEEGIRRACASIPAAEEGISWLISWQMPGANPMEVLGLVPEGIRGRKDVGIFVSDSRGLTRNRNNALRHARGDILLIGDDDLEFYTDNIKKLPSIFDGYGDADVLLLRFAREERGGKVYPEHACEWKKRPKGYYVTSFEIAIRRSGLGDIRFDERFGIGSRFVCGEEDVFVADMLKKGRKVMLYPLEVCRHDHPSTGDRLGATPEFVEAKGAVFRLMYPRTWPLRMLAHAWRQKVFTKKEYLRLWRRGRKRL